MSTISRHLSRIRAAGVLAAAVSAAGCGYSLVGRGSTLPASIRVIRFQTLANETSRVGVEQRVSREVARELATRGRFEVSAGGGAADAEISGAVTQFDLYAVAFDEAGRAKEYQVAVTARVALKTLPDEKVLWENPAYTFRENYTLPATAASYADRENEAIDRVAERFAASLVSSLLEGF
ncbi:MAG TPA: LPS assembly lipoprotein LptE [Thermoanaerobaculia bacterium]|nr:LPS assembly lipoprotein LptE [Thermoanaerobaculia bacterium]